MRALLLAVALALGGCTTLPIGQKQYVCTNSDAEFSVTFSRNPPQAHLEQHGHPPIDLTATQSKGAGPQIYFGDGVQLRVWRRGSAILQRDGAPELTCNEEIIVVT